MSVKSFDQWIAEADATRQIGWDFSRFVNRWETPEPSWNYPERVRQAMRASVSMLDMGTGGGEFLSALAPLPPATWATEGYADNFTLAQNRLAPLGVEVVAVADDDLLPFGDEKFDLASNRHESFSPLEIFRVLKPGGTFLTQQVGGQDCRAINELFQDDVVMPYTHWTLDLSVAQLKQSGLQIIRAVEEYPTTTFSDIGAVVHFLKTTPWQIGDFSIAKYERHLRDLHEKLEKTGVLAVKSHRFFIEARKPSSSL